MAENLLHASGVLFMNLPLMAVYVRQVCNNYNTPNNTEHFESRLARKMRAIHAPTLAEHQTLNNIAAQHSGWAFIRPP
jgi:hypothetical protein